MTRKDPVTLLKRAESRIARALELDEWKLSKGAKTQLELAQRDLNEAIDLENERNKVPEGLTKLSVLINAETFEALKESRSRQRGKNGSVISFTETVRRAISAQKLMLDEWAMGRVIHTMRPDGTKRREVVLNK